jgi:hypothetical protein
MNIISKKMFVIGLLFGFCLGVYIALALVSMVILMVL